MYTEVIEKYVTSKGYKYDDISFLDYITKTSRIKVYIRGKLFVIYDFGENKFIEV